MIDVESFPVTLIHDECGMAAFYLRKRPRPGDLFGSRYAALFNGDPPRPEQRRTCGSCGEMVNNITTRSVFKDALTYEVLP